MEVVKTCPNCNNNFLSEKRQRRKFCSHSCSASSSNKQRKKIKDKICEYCHLSFSTYRRAQKFCSKKCASNYTSSECYKKILSGGTGFKNSYSPKFAKKFIIEEQNHRCAVCKMEDKWNGADIVFVLDHIDGNSTNNDRSNLRLVCPNCDSQLPTFKSRNKNGGRYYRRQRIKDGKSF